MATKNGYGIFMLGIGIVICAYLILSIFAFVELLSSVQFLNIHTYWIGEMVVGICVFVFMAVFFGVKFCMNDSFSNARVNKKIMALFLLQIISTLAVNIILGVYSTGPGKHTTREIMNLINSQNNISNEITIFDEQYIQFIVSVFFTFIMNAAVAYKAFSVVWAYGYSKKSKYETFDNNEEDN